MSKYMNKKKLIIVITMFIVVIVTDKLTKPLPLNYEVAIDHVDNYDDRVEVMFTEDVTRIKMFETQSNEDANIMAYTTLVSRMLEKPIISTAIKTEGLKRIYYEDGIYSNDKITLYGNPIESAIVTKPNLTLNYYFLSSVVILVITLALRGLIENKRGRAVVTSLLSLSSAYVVSNFLIKGFSSSTHFPTRDFTFVIIGSLLLAIPISYMLDDNR